MKSIVRLITGFLAAISCTIAFAASYPDRTVTVIVPFPAGGTTDVLARHVAKALSEKWGQAVVIQNKGGASGTMGSDTVARSKPDGYTLLLTATHHIINASLMASIIPYNTKEDFTSIALIATLPNILVVNKKFAAKTVQELIDLAKKEPGQINYGSAGIGGANHLSGELFAHMADIKLTHVPYRGEAPSITDTVAGHIPMMFGSGPGILSHIKSGDLRALGVTSKTERLPQLPDVPTISEAGVKGFEAVSIFGLYGPKGMPADVVAKISEDTNKILVAPEMKERLTALGAYPGNMSQPEFAAYVNSEIDKWAKVIKAADIKLEK